MRLVASCLKCEASVDAIGKRAVVEDRLSGLMNHILQRILSFLPLRDFVQMCMLAHRYRKQWKFILAITPQHTTPRGTGFKNWFVNCLMIFHNKLWLRAQFL
jgi:hypothetical protein